MSPPASLDELRRICIEGLARTLALPPERIDPAVKFARHGLDSAMAVTYVLELEGLTGLELAPELVFEHPTIELLAGNLWRRILG